MRTGENLGHIVMPKSSRVYIPAFLAKPVPHADHIQKGFHKSVNKAVTLT